MQNCGMPPPPLQVGQKLWWHNRRALNVCFRLAPKFGLKIRSNLIEDLFFFALHLILGRKLDQIWVKTFFYFYFALHLILGRKSGWFWVKQCTFWSLFFSNFLKFLPPLPPFKNPAYATVFTISYTYAPWIVIAYHFLQNVFAIIAGGCASQYRKNRGNTLFFESWTWLLYGLAGSYLVR